MDTLDESSEPATCPHTLSRLPDPAPLRVVSYLLGSSSHPGFPALRPQASGLRLAQQAHTDIPSRTSPGSCLPDTCIWTQRSLLWLHTGGSCCPHTCSVCTFPSLLTATPLVPQAALECPGPLSPHPTAHP